MANYPITRLFDLCTGHAHYPPTPAIGPISSEGLPSNPPHGPWAASGNVFAGNLPVHRMYDIRMPHISLAGIPENIIAAALFPWQWPSPGRTNFPLEDLPSSPEGFPPQLVANYPWLAEGSETVLVNSRRCGRVGDAVCCSSVVITGHHTVIVGGLEKPPGQLVEE